ncbi:YceI family protein [Winogradskyella rapida]|uniref:YceI family protein n=1 Tax=Winogradskyella rapida TaxID=549701 RepID=A0ABW3KPY4_9FLAO
MNNVMKSRILILLVSVSSLFSVQVATSQNYILNNSSSTLEVQGTSSLHDWTLETEDQSGKLVLAEGDAFNISTLNLTVVAESLKSGKSAMDKNTYKALKTDDHKTMLFNLVSVNEIKTVSATSYKVSVSGKMTIAGVTKTISVDLTANLQGSNVILEGKKTFKMTDFGIDPPKALLGTIKTGDDITIVFKSTFNKQ